MSEIIAVRVPKELKEELKALDLDYADEIRRHLEGMAKRAKLEKVIKELDSFRAKIQSTTGMTSSSAEIIREDREHGH